MSEASDLNMQDPNAAENIPNAAENIPAGLAAEIERGLAEANLSSSESADSDGRILDAICEAVIAETPRAAAELAAQNSSEPLASLLHTIQAEAHEYVNPYTRKEGEELLHEIDR